MSISQTDSTFSSLLNASLSNAAFIKLTLGKYRGKEPELERVIIRRVELKGEDHLSFVYRYKTRDITKNFRVEEGIKKIEELLGTEFKSAHLFTTAEEVQIEFSKKGKSRMHRRKVAGAEVPSTEHNRKKERLIDPARPFLRELGITDEKGEIIPSMSRKWKQMNKFVEIFSNALKSSRLGTAEELHVVDFGSGKGYLTFAVYEYLRNRPGLRPKVTGVELRKELTDFCNDVARRLGMEGLEFREGDIRDYTPERIDVMIALHACDTATDLAMHKGISAGADIIMCAPCCHKEVRPQIEMPAVLRPMLRHGVHLGQEADMVTDTLRTLLLEASGYGTSLFEFVSLEHTSKNKMILGVKRSDPAEREKVMEQIDRIKEFYGVREQMLEKLLKEG